MNKKIFLFTLISCAAKIIAFARELLLAYCYGTTVSSDVFLLSMTLPVTLFGFISAGIIPSFIPAYVAAKTNEKADESLQFSNKVISILFAICIAIILFYYIFSKPFIRIIASGFSEEAVNLSVEFTNISVWAILFICITTVLTAYLQINDKLNITALVSVPLNIGVAAAILLAFFLENVYIMPVGFLMASIAQMLYMLFFANKEGFCCRFTFAVKDKQVRYFMKSLVFLSISSSIIQINTLIDRTLATTVISGGLSVFEYGSRINDFIMGLTIIPVSTAMFPEMARLASDTIRLKAKIVEGLRIFLILMVPLSIIVVIFSQSIVKIIYYRGAFGEQSLNLTTQVVFFYGIGLIAFALRELMAKAFYAVSDSITPVINASIGVVLNIILNFVLSRILGIGGLALATSISAFVCIALLLMSLRKKLGNLGLGSLLPAALKIVFISVLCGIISSFVYKRVVFIISNEIMRLGISLLFFVLIFIWLIIKMHIVHMEEFATIFRKCEK